MAITMTKHAEIRAAERSASVDLGHTLFRKALKALKKGQAMQFPEHSGRTRIVWSGWHFITKAEWGDTISGKRLVHALITMYPTKAFRPA